MLNSPAIESDLGSFTLRLERLGPLETFDLNENDLNGGDEFAKDDWIWWLQLTQWPQRRVGVTSTCPHSDLNVTSQWPQRPHNDLNDLNEMSSQKMTEFDDFNLLNDLKEE